MDLTLAEARLREPGIESVRAEARALEAKLAKRTSNERKLQAQVESAEAARTQLASQLAARIAQNEAEDAAAAAAEEGASRFRLAGGGREVDLDIETGDPLGSTELTLQVISFTPAAGCDSRALFFVVQWFHFPPTRTECAHLHHASPTAQGRVLVREGPTGQPLTDQPPGLTVRYLVHGTGPGGSSTRALPAYQASGCVHIEVWDAESLIQLGTARLPLGDMLRQGEERVETLSTVDVKSERAPANELHGSLLLRMVCAGHITPAEMEVEREPAGSRVQCVLPAPASVVRQKHLCRPKPVTESAETHEAFVSTARVEDDTVRSWRLKSAKGMMFDEEGGLTPRPSSARSGLVDGRSATLVKLDAVRAHSRTATIRRALQAAITRTVHIEPSFGRAEYVELVFENPYPDTHTFLLSLPTEEVVVVDDPDEIAAFSEASKGLVSDAQRLDPSTMEVSLTPGERAHIVLKFFSTCCGHPLSLPPEQRGTAVSLCEGNVDEYLPEGVGGAVSLQPEHGHAGHVWHHGEPIAARTLDVSLDAASTGQVAAKLRIAVTPSPPVVDARIHVYRPQNEWFTEQIAVLPYMIPRGKGGCGRHRAGGWRVLCTRGDVVASVKSVGTDGSLKVELRGRAGVTPALVLREFSGLNLFGRQVRRPELRRSTFCFMPTSSTPRLAGFGKLSSTAWMTGPWSPPLVRPPRLRCTPV